MLDQVIATIRGSADRPEARTSLRDSMGVRGIKLRGDDKAISLDVVRSDADLFVVTDTGFGKRVKVERFNRQGRGGQGVRAIKLTAARGFVVAAFMTRLDDEVMLASTGGVLIRTPVREVSSQGRDATGVRVMNLDEGHSVATAALVPTEDDVDSLGGSTGPGPLHDVQDLLSALSAPETMNFESIKKLGTPVMTEFQCTVLIGCAPRP
jgi:DNA gyrase/topoisomerase IV subunit A